ncbi:uncharacterized protein LOC118506134 isoform X2 [Anopheles stephensi]|uniref:uncharacterized protein LOC118506134 isoform X2 n=1 Tax=Anopheles stephensi TaxID=30069 RepID=UPI0016588B87|nr:uncharacterized protein LOC118506134 isoform X2 [Anopheles stephensi]
MEGFSCIQRVRKPIRQSDFGNIVKMRSSSLVLIAILFTAALEHCFAIRGKLIDDDGLVPESSALVLVSNFKKQCAGTLITESIILAPAHCVNRPSTLIPACLWFANNTFYSKPLFTGLSRKKNPSSNVYTYDMVQLKNFKLLNNTECISYGQRKGLLSVNMSEVQGCICYRKIITEKFEGYLNVNLVYDNHVVPYAIGLLSHYLREGKFSIETFVKISYLTEWIKETFRDLGEEVPFSLFDPLACAERYLEQRQKIQGNLLVKKIGSVEYMVQIPDIPDSSPSNQTGTCVGVLIRSDVVVTLAQCANYLIFLSSRVILSDSSSKSIRDVFIHPGYKENTFYNNIALLKLSSETSITPASMYFYSFDNDSVALLGYKKLFFFEDLIETIAEAQQLSILFDDDCNPTQEQRSRLAEGLQVEHMCLRNEHYIVPGSCEARPGSPVVLSSDIGSVIGLSMSGRYCGFGEPAIVTLFHDHLVWISSVLESPPKEWFVFTIPGLKMSDVCVYPEGTVGTCVSLTSCPSVHQRVKNSLPIFFCTDKSIVCCPEDSATEDDVGFAIFRS